jgi:hypothetical protein
MHNKKWSYKKIKKIAGFDKKTFRRYAYFQGFDGVHPDAVKQSGKVANNIDRDIAIKKMYRRSLDKNEIAKIINCSYSVISHVLRDFIHQQNQKNNIVVIDSTPVITEKKISLICENCTRQTKELIRFKGKNICENCLCPDISSRKIEDVATEYRQYSLAGGVF